MTKNRILIAVTAAIFGILVWLSIIIGEQYTITLTVPMAITEVPRGLAIATPVPAAFQLRYRADGWRLILLQFGVPSKIEIPYSVLRKVSSPRGIESASNARLADPADLRLMTQAEVADFAPLRSGIALIGVSPDSTVVFLDRYEERLIPIVPNIVPSFREGYGQVGPITVAPESIVVGGARSVVRSLSSWQTDRVPFNDLRAPLEADVPVGTGTAVPLSFSATTIHVSLNVQPFAEKLIGGIPVEAIGIPPSREIIFVPPRLDLVARGGIKQLSQLSTADFRVQVTYEALLNDTTGTVYPEVSVPAGIHVVHRKPDRLQYIIRKRL